MHTALRTCRSNTDAFCFGVEKVHIFLSRTQFVQFSSPEHRTLRLLHSSQALLRRMVLDDATELIAHVCFDEIIGSNEGKIESVGEGIPLSTENGPNQVHYQYWTRSR